MMFELIELEPVHLIVLEGPGGELDMCGSGVSSASGDGIDATGDFGLATGW